MPGLDPGIHQKKRLEEMDCRVKPGNDGVRAPYIVAIQSISMSKRPNHSGTHTKMRAGGFLGK
jgi:hypothetical protein